MFRSKTSSILNLLLDLYNLNLTGFGKILLWGAIASMSLGNYTTTIKIYVFFCFIFGLFAVAFIYNLFFRFNFSITGSLPEKTSAGQTISYRIRIRNNSKKTVYFLKISEKSLPKTVKKIKNENSMITVLNPGEESEIVNSLYFKNNSGADFGYPTPYNLQYDGFTDVLTAQALNLAPGLHHIKLAIADTRDGILDSGVFIQGGTFSDNQTPYDDDPFETPAPEPSSMLLGALALGGAALKKRNKN